MKGMRGGSTWAQAHAQAHGLPGTGNEVLEYKTERKGGTETQNHPDTQKQTADSRVEETG